MPCSLPKAARLTSVAPFFLLSLATQVAHAASALLPVVALGLMGDGVNSCMQGLLRGAGRQALGAVSNLLSYWLIGIPLAAYLAFRAHLGAFGLWWAVVAVNTLQVRACAGSVHSSIA